MKKATVCYLLTIIFVGFACSACEAPIADNEKYIIYPYPYPYPYYHHRHHRHYPTPPPRPLPPIPPRPHPPVPPRPHPPIPPPPIPPRPHPPIPPPRPYPPHPPVPPRPHPPHILPSSPPLTAKPPGLGEHKKPMKPLKSTELKRPKLFSSKSDANDINVANAENHTGNGD